MNCEEAANLICARIDGEAVDDGAAVALEAHLGDCAGCRATAEAMQLQDATLVRAFAPQRVAAEAVAERVAEAMADRGAGALARPSRMRLWLPLTAALAAGVVVAAVTLGPYLRRSGPQQTDGRPVPGTVPQQAPQSIAQISLRTGDVFTCPTHTPGAWQPVAAGAAVPEGTRVRTGPSARVELRMADGSQVRLNGDTDACFSGGRAVELKQGQLWSAVPQDSQPLRVSMPPGDGGTATAVAAPGSRLDVSCESRESVLTAVHGPAKLTDRRGAETHVPAGESVRIVDGLLSGRSTAGDVLLATRWLNDLLLLKGRDDPELTARVNELLSRINAENATTRPASAPGVLAPGVPGPVEQFVRAQGDQWSAPMACYVQSPASQADRSKRLTAARLLADLAPPWAIPDLIALLGDRDGEVRFHAATALQRLTGQTLGVSPAACASDSGPAVELTQKKWQAWWEQNKGRHADKSQIPSTKSQTSSNQK
jgi:ferric-dicitrate binding protein FerR (iron transport regulator)